MNRQNAGSIYQLWHFEGARVAIRCKLQGVDQVVEYLDKNTLKWIAKIPTNAKVSGFLGEINTQSGRCLCYSNLVEEQILLVHLLDGTMQPLQMGESQSRNAWGLCECGGSVFFGNEFGDIFALNYKLEWEIAFESICRDWRLLRVLSNSRAVFVDLSLRKLILVDLASRVFRPILLPREFVSDVAEARKLAHVVECGDWLAIGAGGLPMHCFRITGDGPISGYGPFGLPVAGARDAGWVVSAAYHRAQNKLLYIGAAWIEPKINGHKSKRALNLCTLDFDDGHPRISVNAGGDSLGNEVIAGFLFPKEDLFVTGGGKFYDLSGNYSGSLADMVVNRDK